MRYLPHSSAERADMLAVIGAKTAEDLFGAVPRSALLTEPVNLPAHSPEFLVEARMRALASKNRAGADGPFFVGAGAYRHHARAIALGQTERSGRRGDCTFLQHGGL